MRNIICRSFFCLVFIQLFYSKINGQTGFQWGGSMECSLPISASYSVCDGAGNLYIAGGISDSIDFDLNPATTYWFDSVYPKIFIAKYSPSGTLIWVNAYGAWNSAPSVRGLKIDSNGDILISGDFQNSMNFNGGSVGSITSAGSKDIFLARLNSSGSILWAISAGGTGNETGGRLSVDGSGIYVTGAFSGIADFQPGSGVTNLVNTASAPGAFIAKYSSTGNLLWAHSLAATVTSLGVDVASDHMGGFYVTGTFEGICDFNPGAGTSIFNVSIRSTFLVSFDYNGIFKWAKHFYNGSTCYVYAITTDIAGNCILTGSYTATMDFNPGGTPVNLNTLCSYGIYITKYNANGVLIYAIPIGETNVNLGFAITTDISGNLYITGRIYAGWVDFDPGPGSALLLSQGIANAFLAKYNPAGNYVSAILFPTSARTIGETIASDYQGNIYVTGFFDGPSAFDSGNSQFILTPLGYNDIFVCKYSDQFTTTFDEVSPLHSLHVFPNPAGNLLNLNFSTHLLLEQKDQILSNLIITGLAGQEIRTNLNFSIVDSFTCQIDISSLPAGFYLLRLESDTGSLVKKFVKQ